jgi:hypothetical protein
MLGSGRSPALEGGLGPVRSPEAVAARIAGLVSWPEAGDPPPGWLLPAQRSSFRRGLAAIRAYRGVLLTDPVGSGKTYVALAIALAVRPGRIRVIAPAVLLAQWERVAALLQLEIALISHERISRGEQFEDPAEVPVIVDESHRFRNPETRRYRNLAPRLVGRSTVLVSATPVVNRLADVAHQLVLAVRDDALRLHGVPSLRGLLTTAEAAPVSLGRLLVRTEQEPGATPDRRDRSVEWLPDDDPHFARALTAIDGLRLSTDEGIAALVRLGLYRALGSSPAALLAAVVRYRTLVEHGWAARRAGRRVSRREVWEAAGLIPEQLVMWELYDQRDQPCELAVSDRGRLATLEALLKRWLEAGDRKTALLRAVVGDRIGTVVFSGLIETVAHLRRTLGLPGIAWITGDRAGFGSLRAARRTVLEAFAPNGRAAGSSPDRPWLLLATDVAAEGLDLQRAARIIHFDLPWTAVRLEQRAGRAVRRGSEHREVELIRFELPPELEKRLALGERLERKARLPALIGLERRLDQGWRVSARLAEAFDPIGSRTGWVVVESPDRFDLLGAEIGWGPDRSAIVLGRTQSTDWTDDLALIEALLVRARAAPLIGTAGQESIDQAIRAARPLMTSRLAAASGSALLTGTDGPAASAVRRIEAVAAECVRSRRFEGLERLDRILRFLRRGHSAGEEVLVRTLARAESPALDLAASLAEPAERPVFSLVAAISGRPQSEGEHG